MSSTNTPAPLPTIGLEGPMDYYAAPDIERALADLFARGIERGTLYGDQRISLQPLPPAVAELLARYVVSQLDRAGPVLRCGYPPEPHKGGGKPDRI